VQKHAFLRRNYGKITENSELTPFEPPKHPFSGSNPAHTLHTLFQIVVCIKVFRSLRKFLRITFFGSSAGFRIVACVMANANKSICIIVIVLSFRLFFAKREQGGQGRIQSPAAATGKQPKEIFLKNLQNQTCISKEIMIYYL